MAINSLSSSSKGLSGLVSGMDTQQMVDSMLAGTQGKIDAANQKKSQLTYKQSMYRDVASKMKAFQNSFLSYTGTSGINLMSPSFFSSMTATSSSNAFKVTATSSASTDKSVVNYVRQLAQNMRVKSNSAATGKLEGSFDATKLNDIISKLKDGNNSLKIEADGAAAVEISLDKLAGKSSFEIEKVLQDSLAAAGSDVTVAYKNGQFTFTEKNGKALNINGTKEAMALVGLGRETGLYGEKGVISTTLDGKNLLPSIDVTFNGVKKSITFDPLTVTSAADLASQLNDAVHNAFGSGISVEQNTTTGKIEFTTKDKSSKITLGRPSSQENGLNVLGIASGTSSKITMNMKVGEANFATRVAGDVQRFSINGVDFSFSADTELNTIVSTINNSAAGVKISYLDVEDRFVIESKTTGELGTIDPDNPFKMSQQEGNLLTALFGVQPGSAATGNSLTYNKDAIGTAYAPGIAFDTEGIMAKVKSGDTTFMFEMPARDDGTKNYTMQEIVDEFNKIAEGSFGKDALKFSVETNAAGMEQLKIESPTGAKLEIEGLDKLGVAGSVSIGTTIATESTTLKQIGLDSTTVNIGGTAVDLTGVTTVGELQQKLDAAVKAKAGLNAGVDFDESTGRYRIFGVDIPMTIQISGDDGKMFGASEFTLGAIAGESPDMTVVQKGQNAIVSINGVEIERNSNEFTVGGLSYELKDVNIKQATDSGGNLLYLDENGNKTTSAISATGEPNRIAGADNAEAITVSRDTDKVFEGLKKFVEEYNKLVDGVNKLLDEDATYRKYSPLTAKQKETMSDKEVELWEEKAKGGLMRNDSTLEGVMQNLRGTLYKKPEGGRFALYDIGITTQLTNESRDTLFIDESKLKQALAENPDEIAKLFTDTTSGFGRQLDNAIQAAVNTSPANPGSIVRQAGAVGFTDSSSFLAREIKGIDTRLSSLERTYKKEYERYWAQFNKMEQVVANMNQQSSWLSQQFA